MRKRVVSKNTIFETQDIRIEVLNSVDTHAVSQGEHYHHILVNIQPIGILYRQKDHFHAFDIHGNVLDQDQIDSLYT